MSAFQLGWAAWKNCCKKICKQNFCLRIKEFVKEQYIKNSYYQGLVQNLYGGSKGCFSAFMQFFYQYERCEQFMPQFQGTLRKLYENELKNCKILSKIIIKMGGENKYYSSSRKFLTAASINYVQDFSKAMLADIELLEIGILELSSTINTISCKKITDELLVVLENKKSSLRLLKENFFKANMIN